GVRRDAVDEAARAAGLGELLDRLPDGLNTIAGERGLTLSAGERQRVALARAFLANPEVLILDEPTAALDMDRERELFESLRRVFRGKTVIAITHKPLLARAADYVLRVEGGRVVESPVMV
ncbi:MAG: ATP-binding cassette domain-containing protein, partial [Acidobacteriia bacterium]|nr:ATP-binding cassette domain-containing protein [Terriglobia bacterium]